MSPRRSLVRLPVPAGEAALDVLPALHRSLDGAGPALLPVPATEPKNADRVAVTLGAGELLGTGEDDPEDPTALVIATSGTTGDPKGVLLGASALRSSAKATHERLGGPGRWLLALPAHHIAGIQVLARSLTSGTTPAVADTTEGFRADRFADAARSALRGAERCYTALVPTQLSRLLAEDGPALRALREFDAVLLGGAAAPATLLERAHEASVNIVTTYGMSETAGGCVYDGVPLGGTKVRIDSTPEDHGTGVVHLSGPTLARGYRHGGEANAAFTAGWFRTCDVGRENNGRLEVVGRADDLIVTGGVNIAPAVVESILTEQHQVREACVVGIADPEWGQAVAAAIVPVDASEPPAVATLRAAVRERAGAAAAPKQIAVLGEIPLRGPGKPDLRTLREVFKGRE
jgi:O-succinylbenzoic acid--CoA ligase